MYAAESANVFAAETEALTEPDSDDFTIVGGKRIPSNGLDPRYVTLQNGAS